MAIAIKSNIMWAGKADWEIRRFHGEEYSTNRGTSYNCYLVRDKKTALIDTVWDPFSAEFLERLSSLINLSDIDYIVANHAAAWADAYQENQITVVYDTMWNGTRKMAEAIARGIIEEDFSTKVKIFNIARSDKNDVATEVFKSKGLLVGSPTINRGILSAAAGFLELVRGLGFKNKKAAAFGCYGWSGESVKMI